jgi:hypothetical protein
MSQAMSRAAHRHIYSFFTALRAPLFIHIFTQTHHIPLPQLVQAVTGHWKGELQVCQEQVWRRIQTMAGEKEVDRPLKRLSKTSQRTRTEIIGNFIVNQNNKPLTNNWKLFVVKR